MCLANHGVLIGLLGLNALFLSALWTSAGFTCNRYWGTDCLLAVGHGDVTFGVITDRRYSAMDWDDACYPEATPTAGLVRNTDRGLAWHMPWLHKEFHSPLGTWWELRLPLWVLLAASLTVLGLRVRRSRSRSRRCQGKAGVVMMNRLPWTKGGRAAAGASLAGTLLVGFLWAFSTRWQAARYDGTYVVEIDRCALVVRTVPGAEDSVRWDERPGWEFCPRYSPGLHWELPHTADLGQSTIGTWWELVLPLWNLALLTAAPGLLLLWRHRRRRVPGFCRKCGYNLTGNVSGRCPECGCATESLEKEECQMGP
ncbi:MAG: hypothetical protein AB1716_11125 [Planctomycetota bacterium]